MTPDGAPVALRFDGPDGASDTVVLAHGAGAPMDSPFMNRIADGLASLGVRAVRFEFPYMELRRSRGVRRPPDRPDVLRAAWTAVVEELGGGNGLVIGGKSLGGRIASMIADDVGARGLVCLGYPFHPPGRPERPRIAHLENLRTPTLIVQGTRDPFGLPSEIDAYPLSPAIRIAFVEDGDHSLKPRVRSGRTERQNLSDAVDAISRFLSRL